MHALHSPIIKKKANSLVNFHLLNFPALCMIALQHSPKLLSNSLSAQILPTLLEYVIQKAESYQSYVLSRYIWVYEYECPSNFALFASPFCACRVFTVVVVHSHM